MFRDFDGKLGCFGDVSIPAVSTDVANVSAYFSQDSGKRDRFVAVLINRSKDSQEVSFNGLDFSGSARIFRLSGGRTAPSFVEQLDVNLGGWSISLPSLSISTIELLREQPHRSP